MPLLEQVLRKYPKEVKLVFKNFPLRMHKFARTAAEAAMASDRQGKFWEFHDMLFENYSSLDNRKIREIAVSVGLDMEKFDESAKDPQITATIQRDIKEATDAGVRGTPTVFVNGRLLKNRSLQGFQVIIEKELRKRGR